MPRQAVSRDRLIELIKARVAARLPHLGDVPAPLPVPVQPVGGSANWKIEQVVGVPSSAFTAYMAVIREVMAEYELTSVGLPQPGHQTRLADDADHSAPSPWQAKPGSCGSR